MPNSDGVDREFDLMHRLSRVENMIEEIIRRQTWPMQSGAAKIIPQKKEKRERLKKRSRSRSSKSESDTNFFDAITRKKQGQREGGCRTYSRTKRLEDEEDSA
ncbi:uncharacterized protein MONOS_6835 [Monocercomonoides exilis]|uniref:uncharacterized protein n=1 Tax=Monocercomonoides exilis TaxID=2049356 RepID=UPI003559BAC5|nr:hypothetical protein MONOS_6835 [Monocercomonoides exilis]|eukprot:MONOS_6835.1-p1 / transcript=MONOS_6835.1 / gene=MONOS_6835 / organism=Monocercomonoides_exilis_PA203 / gene_product=unspecified product / transcript_product=unspecified product / location=Mono_scaffold00223:23261-23569(-) / protein_length=103 / sequence_SO=supercontig / SO=protein_coding / is_pseudo=false